MTICGDRSRYARWILLTASLTASAFATSVVVIRRPNVLIVGSDSLFLKGGHQEFGCKIRHHNTTFFAAAGLASDTETAFDVDELAAQAATEAKTVQRAADIFMARARTPFIRSLEQIRAEYPDFYRRVIKHGPEPLQVVFFAVEQQIPTFVVVYFAIKDDSTSPIKVTVHYKSCPGSACRGGDAAELLGENAASNRIGRRLSPEDDDVETVRRMIEAEKTDLPSRVNGPTEIIVIDAKGFHWADNAQNCN